MRSPTLLDEGELSSTEDPNSVLRNFYPQGGLPPNPYQVRNQQPAQNPPPVQPGMPPVVILRQSGRTRRQPAPRPGDVYGNRNPTQRHQMDLRSQLPNEGTPVQPSGGSPIASDPPSPSSILGDPLIDLPTDPWNAGALHYQDPELILPRLAQEGGAPLISFLLVKAIPSDNEKDKSLPPATSEVRSWQYQDILQLPKVQKEE